MAQKKIRSHRERVKQANDVIKNWPKKVSFIDREAFVEFFLLEDMVRLFETELQRIKGKPEPKTAAGKVSKASSIKLLNSARHLAESAVEVASDKLELGRFEELWKAIPEGALMRAANSLKHLDRIEAMLSDVLGQLSPEALAAVKLVIEHEERVANIQDHEKNFLAVENISIDEFDAITNPESVSVVDDNEIGAVKKSNVNIKPN